MKERIAEASPGPWARTTGLVYLLCFLTAVSAEAFVGQVRHVTYDAVNLIAYAFYIAVTLLCYYMPSKSAPFYFSGRLILEKITFAAASKQSRLKPILPLSVSRPLLET